MRFSRPYRHPDPASPREPVPLRRIVLWVLVALAIVVGVALYFVYGPRVATLIV